MIGLGLLFACAEERGPGAGEGADTQEMVFVNRSILFSREVEGISEGFDLDGEVSEVGGGTGCGVGDFVAPDGTPGIDNAFARMLPALEATEAVAVESLVQQAINSGNLLLMVKVSDVDDSRDDPSVDVEVFRGAGAPLLGSDGKMLASQTFEFDATNAVTTATGVSLVDGVIQADGLALSLPVQIFDVFLDLHLLNASYRLTAPEEEGAPWAGLMAGGVETSAIQAIADGGNVDAALGGVVSALLSANADLADNGLGGCAELSMTFETELVASFLYPE